MAKRKIVAMVSSGDGWLFTVQCRLGSISCEVGMYVKIPVSSVAL